MAEDIDDMTEELAEDEPDEPDLEELDDEELLGDELDEDAELDDEDLGDGVDVSAAEILPEPGTNGAAEPAVSNRRRRSGEDEEEDEEEEELGDDDVEAGLDEILKERLVAEEDEEEDEEGPDTEDRVDGTARVLPKQPGEFVCRSCFLVKNRSQLADSERTLCRDCV